MAKDLLTIFYSYMFLWVFQLATVPFLIKYTHKKLVDAGWAWARVVTWLVLGLSIWFLAHFGIPVNTRLGVTLALIVLMLFSWKTFEQNKKIIFKTFQKAKSLIITEEILFLFGFFFLSIVRSFNPAVNGLEKFMDAGLIVSYLRSPTLPAIDMWLAGETINYYTFGHFLGAIVSHVWNLNIAYSYNLLLGLIMGLVMTQAFSIVVNFLADVLSPTTIKERPIKKVLRKIANRRKIFNFNPLIVAGVLAAFLLALGGNGHTTWYFFDNNWSFDKYWYPDATRFIDRTIHEFTSYSFIVSDLHAHVWDMPVVLLFILSAFLWVKALVGSFKEKVFHKAEYFSWAIILGIIFGIFTMTSSWDVLIYGLFMCILGSILLFFNWHFFKGLFISAITIGIIMLLTSSMWWLNFDSISEGMRIAEEKSPLWQLIVLWAPHFLLSSLAAFFAFSQFNKKNKNNYGLLMIVVMFLTSLALVILPEFIYMKDIYPNHPRANTMFKLMFQAMLMMNLIVGWLIGFIQDKKKFDFALSLVLKILVSIFVLAVGIYPYFGYRDFYGINFEAGPSLKNKPTLEKIRLIKERNINNYDGLDGLSWLKKDHPSDYEAIMWIDQNIDGRPVIAEAVGESYTTFARVSTFTGLPTVLGWRVHEWLWRGGFDIPSARTEEVRKIYEEPLSKDTEAILNKYQVEYVFVGDKEREAYKKIDQESIYQLGEVIFKEDDTFIIAIK